MIKKNFFLVILCLILVLTGCTKEPTLDELHPRNDVYYQIFVRSFADSNNDGIGDFNGITAKLDYFKEMGIGGLWLMPVNPSPSYHGYDVTDYYDVNPDYGTLDDFKKLLKESEKKGINIMLDMVFNHTSNQHPWFQAALNNDAKYKNYYTFATSTTNRALLGSWGQNLWHYNGDKYYVGYFSHTMPDLNFFNEEVKNEIYNIGKYWNDLGVDGFRLDAVNHFYGTNEYQDKSYDNYENIIFTQLLRNRLREFNKDFYLIGEIMENAESIVNPFFRGLDSPLDFPVSSRLTTVAMSNGNSTYANQLYKVYNLYRDSFNNFISTPFLFNHDQDRVADRMNGDISKMKLAAEMLMTLPGSPIMYYGEEIGMYGVKSNGEKSDGVDIWDETRRLPIPFGDSYTTKWFTDVNFSSVVKNSQIPTVTEQMENQDSLWNTYKAIINVRNNNMALKYGNSFAVYEGNNFKIQGFYREYQFENQSQKVLVIHNLSKEDLPMVEYNGKIIYASGKTDYTNLTTIKAKSTIIIDVTGEAND